MASAAVVRQRVKDYLYGSDYLKRPFTDFLNQDGNVSSTDTVITVSNIASWGVGDIVEFNTGEQAYIKNVSTDNNRFTVARAWNGTTAAQVTDLTAIEKNPKFTYAKIDNAVAAIIDELYPEVYIFHTGSSTANKNSWYYTTNDTGLKEILSVYYPRSGSLGNNEPWVINTWKMNKHMHTSGFANGIGITMWDYGELDHGDTFYYTFSPTVADYERENPVFKEAVKVGLTPLLTSLTILNYVDIDTEQEMLGYGIGIIMLNIGMYFVAPAVVVIALSKKLRK